MKKPHYFYENRLSTPCFTGVSIVLPVMNETTSLTQTIETIEQDCANDIQEYIIVVCNKTTKESLHVIDSYTKKDAQRFKLHWQRLPFLGNAIREGFMLASSSHTISMGSDLETNPEDVKHLIHQSKLHPGDIITATRWRRKNAFHGYGRLKLFLNYGFQQGLKLLYLSKLSDMTFCFRIFPTALLHEINWQESKHPFLLETLLKPLRLGYKIFEIDTTWHPRREGESQNSLWTMFSYIPIVIKCRLLPRTALLKTRNRL